MTTTTERNVRHRRKRNGILVPLLEDLFREPLRIENDEDFHFIQNLIHKGQERERRRKSRAVFSPSALASCLRQVYLTRHHRALEIKPLRSTRMEPNFYFLTGEWLHIKWQFACWKLQQKINDPRIFRLIDCEYPIMSKRGDHGGTVDVLAAVNGEPMIVDFKGLNVNSFTSIVRGNASGYEIQLADYIMLYNSHPDHRSRGERIERALLVVENKGGPTSGHPIALHERVVDLKDYKGLVQHRLGVLRDHEAKEEIPEPECNSTSSYQFQGCPFRGYCRKEVEAIQRKQKRKLQRSKSDYKVARPTQTTRRARK
jgi:PD-(D/E)XK nuclease superfamily